MSLFDDFHQLSKGLELIEKLTKTTQDLVLQCEKLNDNIGQLILVLEQQNKKQTKSKNNLEKS